MANLISSSSDLASSLQPLDGDGLTREELAKRFYEFQAQIDRLKEENRRINARNLVLEELCRGQLRSLEDKDEAIIRLKEDALSMSGAEGRLNEKCKRLIDKSRKVREDSEQEERELRRKLKEAEDSCWKMGVEKTKLEISLEAARKALDSGGEVGEKVKEAEAEVEKMKSVLEDKEGMIAAMERRNEGLEREKRKVEENLRDRVVKLEEAVSKWVGMSPPGMDDFGADVRVKGNADSKDSGPKSAKSLIQPKDEILEGEIQVEHGEKTVDSEDLEMGKEVSFAHKSTDPLVVEISDDEEEDKRSSCNEFNPTAAPCVASPLTSKFKVNLAVPCKRKAGAVTHSVERQSEAKRSKCDGPKDGGKSWETAEKMFNAFTTNRELCMKSICALYRKHKSLGVWKNHSNRVAVYQEGLQISAVELGEFLTGGDPEGRMTKSLAELEQKNPKRIEDCRFISRKHFKELFEIYSRNEDPLFKP